VIFSSRLLAKASTPQAADLHTSSAKEAFSYFGTPIDTTTTIMSYPTLAPFVLKRPWLKNLLMPVANWYANAAGYRAMGLRFVRCQTLPAPELHHSEYSQLLTYTCFTYRADDLIIEEDENVQLALKRLPPREAYDRVYRIRRATQLSVQHKLLPKDQWTKPEEDVPYLVPLIKEIIAEQKEREALDTVEVIPKH